jgi:hypothetical protein
MGAIVSVLIFGAVVGGIILVSYLWDKKRTEKMSLVAAEMGLPFYAQGDASLISELSNFPLFSEGSSKKIKNMLHGMTSDVEVGVFDYRYTTWTGKHRHVYKQTVAYFQSPELDCSEFALRPENLFDKIGGVFGFQDIDFESHPRFSDSYLLRGNSEVKIRRLFNDEVLAFFERQTALSVEGSGQRLIFYRASERVEPEKVRSFLEEGFSVFTFFKDSSGPRQPV